MVRLRNKFYHHHTIFTQFGVIKKNLIKGVVTTRYGPNASEKANRSMLTLIKLLQQSPPFALRLQIALNFFCT